MTVTVTSQDHTQWVRGDKKPAEAARGNDNYEFSPYAGNQRFDIPTQAHLVLRSECSKGAGQGRKHGVKFDVSNRL
jgi:hypothetical protein